MSQFVFSEVPTANIQRSRFDRSFGHKTTFDAGYLVPVFVDEVLPGDTFEVSASLLARLATPVVPVMDNMYLDMFFFFVPNRLVWSNWQKFMGEQVTPGDSIDYLVPVTSATNFAEGSLFDFLGVPTKVNNTVCTTLVPRAYNLIWNTWFRDENLCTPATVPLGDGPDSPSLFVMRKRGKRHDYFTSCLPWPIKGTAPTIPLGSTAPVIANTNQNQPLFRWSDGATNFAVNALASSTDLISSVMNPAGATRSMTWRPGYFSGTDSNTGLVADLTAATGATINSLREAFQIQRLLERDARGGTRYTEILRSHFGVVSPDGRLQRPEYLGGGSAPVMLNPVSQTSSTDATSPKGSLSAYGVAGARGIGFTKSFVEHGHVIGLVCARAEMSYEKGLHRRFSRRTRYDFYWPAFAHLGEQAVKNKELYFQGTSDDELVFGYQERWAEYRYAPSLVTGLFRSNATGTLNFWHLAQTYTALPTLNETFITEYPPMDRIKAVVTEPDFIFDSQFRVMCTRPMPMYSVPGLIDHF